MIRKRVDARLTYLLVLLCFQLTPTFCGAKESLEPNLIRGETLLRTIRDLAAPEMEGRAAGTAGEANAAKYIAREFRRIGLKPPRSLGSYFQGFKMTTGLKLGSANHLRLELPNETKAYAPGLSFSPFGFSDEGRMRGRVVFAGYGISAPELGYDDYAGLDVRDRIVLVMTHEPQEKKPGSPFRAPEAFRYRGVRYKAWNAREHGARGIIIVADPNNHPEPQESLFALRGGGSASAGISAVNALREVADALLGAAGKNLAELQEQIDLALTPRSFDIPEALVHLEVDLIREKGQAANVIGVLPGIDSKLGAEAVIIGAHYDGLGRGSEGSLAPEQHGVIHPGADDNASGVAGILGLAEAFARRRARRTLVFAAFSGEELGLLGSSAYVKNPLWSLKKTYAMINLDMIGRPVEERLFALGVDSAREFRPLLQSLAERSGLRLAYRGDAFGPSDHTSFHARGKPVLMFHTGPHSDYHRPSDTAQKIEPQGLEKVVRFVFQAVAELADRPRPLTFVKTNGEPAAGRGRRGGYGAYFGSIPDFSESEIAGVRLSGVRPGSPAERAGLQAGDVIVGLGEANIRSLADLLFALRSRRGGEEVEVLYLREGKKMSGRATLQERR